MGRQQAAELRRGAVEMLCSSLADTADPVRHATMWLTCNAIGKTEIPLFHVLESC